MPFEDSRRLTGPNLFFADGGAVLEAQGAAAVDPARHARWRAGIERMACALDWPQPVTVVRCHHRGASLALSAPADQWMTATELNEWAWCTASGDHAGYAPGHPASWDEASARETLRAFAAMERSPALRALLAAAAARALPALVDDETLSIGLGAGSQGWPLAGLPQPEAAPWSVLRTVPTALVTGSNGKTTTVRLLAAMLEAHGWRTGYNCTDGVVVAGASVASGDWSGPAGARSVLRHPAVEAAVLETARGGILRRGLALSRADAAAVTNVSADHFGEYGIDDLDALAEVKLVVARALEPEGVLVLNADDPLLLRKADALGVRHAWFASSHEHPRLQRCRAEGGRSCAPHAGRMLLAGGAHVEDLGAIATMPIGMDGRAPHNLANAACAALLAAVLGVQAATLAEVLARFGSRRDDNPGRLQRWSVGGVEVLLDYAHNPDGLARLLAVAGAMRGAGRLGMLLGQAGNRSDDDVRELAGVAAAARPDLVVLKDLEGYLRGRAQGEVPRILREELLRQGLQSASLAERSAELEAVRHALEWARPGDLLVLPVHGQQARAQTVDWLDWLEKSEWTAGAALPEPV